MKNIFLIIFISIALVVVSGCSTGVSESSEQSSTPVSSEETGLSDSKQESSSSDEENLKIFTLEELSEFDGKEGRKAYVAIDGLVYDVTDVSAWSGGSHFRNTTAGKDLTDILFDDSPHGARVLENLTIVGRLEK